MPNSSSEQKSLRAWLHSILSKSCADVFGWLWDVLEIFTFFCFFCHVLVATAKSFTQALVGSDPHRKRPAGRRPPGALLPAARRPDEAGHGRGVSDGLRAGLQFQGDLSG